MFWQAVWNGIKVLSHWETGLVATLYFALLIVPLAAVGRLMNRHSGMGCAAYLLVLPFTQVFATIVAAWILSPIILGISQEPAWTLPWWVLMNDPLYMIKVVVTITVATVLAAFVPVLGQMPTFLSLVATGMAIAAVAVALTYSTPELVGVTLDLVPPFGMTIGFLFFGAIAGLLGAAIVAVIDMVRTNLRSQTTPEDPERDIFAMATASGFGLVPGFMYGAWLGLQLQT